jgi:hypothetical protein
MDAFTLDALAIAAVLFLTLASMAGWLDDREPPTQRLPTGRRKTKVNTDRN